MSRKIRIAIFAAIAIACSVPAHAQTIGGGGISGLGTHDHSSAALGGRTLKDVRFARDGAQSEKFGIVSHQDTGAVYFGFYRSDGTTRKGYFGFGSSGDNHIYLENEEVGGNIRVADTLESTKACASGYSRVGPNMCIATDLPTLAAGPDLTLNAWTTVNSTILDGAKCAFLRVLHLKGTTVGDSNTYIRPTGSASGVQAALEAVRNPDNDGGTQNAAQLFGSRIVMLNANGDFDYHYVCPSCSAIGSEGGLYVDAYCD